MIGELKDLYDLIINYLVNMGLAQWVATLIFLTPIVLYYLYKLLDGISVRIKKRHLDKDLHPFFTKYEIDKALRYYIPTKYQDTPPSQAEEPGRKFIDSPKAKLIPMFLKTAFKRDDNRFYLILADSGMGKTTFMMNLYWRYKKGWKWGKPKYNIRLLPLGNSNTLAEIDNIEDKENTILLLDAFDEDNKAIYDYEARLTEILKKVWRFREIVITSRTQFFPSRAEEPHETGFLKHGTDGGEFYFRKAYVSVFSDWDIKRYLFKRYNILSPFQWKKLRHAWKIVSKSPNLMVRPMLLSHIKDLESGRENYDYAYQIYEVLIEKWIDREAKKPGLKEKYGSIETYKKKLLDFSQKLAVNIYQNREQRGGLLISKDQELAKTDLQLSDLEEDIKNITLRESEIRTRSLLNRDVEGNYKFSHKSVLEYFLAKEAFENQGFLKELKISGMDAANAFILDMILEKEMQTWDTSKTKMSLREAFSARITNANLGSEAWRILGVRYREQGDFEKSIAYFQKALSINKHNTYAWNGLGNAYHDQEEYEKSQECYEKALSINKYNTYAWNGLGNAYHDQEEYEKSQECYEKALSIKKDFAYAWNGLGIIYRKQEEYQKSQECYEKALSIKKDHIFLYNLGVLYDDQEEYSKSQEYYEKALSIKKDYVLAWDGLGDIYRNQGEYDKAIECYEKALSIKKDYANAWNGLGNVYFDQGEYDKAIESYKKALSIDKDNANAWDGLGIVYSYQGEYDKAKESYEKALSTRITPRSLVNDGFLNLRLGRLKEAKEILEQDLKHSGKNLGFTYQNLGHVYMIEGKQMEAISSYKKGLESLQKMASVSRYFRGMEEDYHLINFLAEKISKQDYGDIIEKLKVNIDSMVVLLLVLLV